MTLKIKRSDLESLSRDELYDVARKLKKFEDAKQSLRLEEYLETAHPGQLDFHKAKNRVRLFLGGNRCLREDQRIWTNNGLRAIADICEGNYVLSFDQKSKMFSSSLTSAAFPKRKDDLYRVVHEGGEFVASSAHRVFLLNGGYSSVDRLEVGSDLFSSVEEVSNDFSQIQSTEGFSQSKCVLGERHLCETSEGLRDDCLKYIHLYGQRLRLLSDADQGFFQQLLDESSYVFSCLFLESSQLGDQSVSRSMRNHFCRLRNHLSNQDQRLLPSDQFLIFLGDLVSLEFYQRNDQGNQPLSQSLLMLADLSQSLLFSLSRALLNVEDSSQRSQYRGTKVLSIEKCGHDWLWNISVLNKNNYITEDNTLHKNSGKTSAGTIELLWRIGGIHPFTQSPTPIKAMMLGMDFQTHVKDVLIPKILSWAPKDFFTKVERNQQGTPVKFFCKSGSTLDVKSQDQDIKVFEGSDYDYVWIDEPCPQNIFTAIFRGLTDRGGSLSFTGTPLTYPWIADLYNQASQQGNKGMYWSKFINTYDNAVNLGEGNLAVGQQRIRDFESTLSKDERAARIEGKFLHLQGLIFKDWNRTEHLVDTFPWPTTWPIWVSIDPAQAKPWAVSFIGFTPSGAKILIRSDLVEGVVEDVANYLMTARDEIEMADKKSKPRIQKVIIDNAANVDSMIKRQTTITSELNSHIQPVFPGIESGPKNVKQKINIFKTWLKPTENKYGKRPSFFVFNDGNDQFIHEIERYSWKTNRGKIHEGFKEAPVKKDDDVIDTVLQVALIVGSKEVVFNEPKPLKYTY